MPDPSPLDAIQSQTTPQSAAPHQDPQASTPAPPLPTPSAPFTPLDPSGQPMPPIPSTDFSFGTPPTFNPDAGPSPQTSTLDDQTPGNVYGSLDRPTPPIVQTHEGPIPLPVSPGAAHPSQEPIAKGGPENHRTYLLFLIGLGIIFFIVLAIAYLTKPH